MTDPAPRKRSASRGPRAMGALHQMPFGQVPCGYAPTEVLSADHVMAIHRSALRVLAEIGMAVLEPRARALFAQAGAEVSGETVRLDADLVGSLLATVPRTFGLEARNPARNLRFGGAVSYLTSGSQSLAQGATFNATADNDWAYAISGSYKISF